MGPKGIVAVSRKKLLGCQVERAITIGVGGTYRGLLSNVAEAARGTGAKAKGAGWDNTKRARQPERSKGEES